MAQAPSTLANFLNDVRQVRRTGQATAEQSFYPAVQNLLSAVGGAGTVERAALTHPSGIEGKFPDLAMYETASLVLSLPVEVKPASYSIDTLRASNQAIDYANTYGGGVVLLTNLREWELARLDTATGTLVGERRVTLVGNETDLDKANPAIPVTAWDDLVMLIESGCQVRGAYASPKTVAHLLAYHARNMRDAITSAGDPKVLLSTINDALAKGLQIEVDAEMLTPTVVQTLVYGAFAAWLGVDDPQRFDWMQASYRLNVPVFAEILHESLRPALLRKCDLPRHLHAVARVLSWTNRAQFESAFDGDAIQYFYEPFLAEFDPTLRDRLGVWYTPREIAEYQASRAHHHLQQDLGIPDGLASDEVYLLDPAVGTGTYLLATAKLIYEFHRANGEPATVAAERTQTALTTRLIGFEILPAAFIICHLHLARYLHTLGAPESDKRLRVYLTNSLTGWGAADDPTGMTLFPELEDELHDAAIAKRRDPVLVVLGNPPYQGYSAAETAEEQAMLQPWIDELWPVWHLRKHRLNDLYVRFWRIAIERIVHLTNRGVVSFITNRKWLGGRSYPSMRQAVCTSFDSIWVDDLHGTANDRTVPGDQSIFTTNIAPGIKVGTAIVTAVRTGDQSAPTASARRLDYRGSADHKRKQLATRGQSQQINDGYAAAFTPSASTWFRLVDDQGGDFPVLNEYLPKFVSGVQPVRDEAVLDTDKATLQARMADYFDSSQSTADVIKAHPGFGVSRARYNPEVVRARLLKNSSYDPDRIVRYIYRPLDTRWLYWETEAKLLNEARRDLLPYWVNAHGRVDQLCLVAPQTPRRKGAVRPVAGGAVGGFATAEPDARVFPLYNPTSRLLGEKAGELAFDVTEDSPPTTVAPEWVLAARNVLGLPDDRDAGEAVFYALLTVMQSPKWIDDQPVEMDDFPQVPLPSDPQALGDAVEIGRELVELLDPDRDVPTVTSGTIRANLRDLAIPDAVSGTVAVSFGRYGERAGTYDNGDVLWATGQGWRNVPKPVWDFSACGFQVLPKWLSYRKKTGITSADRETFRLLARRIQAILDLAADCDTAYASAIASPLTSTIEP